MSLPPLASEWLALPAHALIPKLQSGEISSLELTQAFIGRIKEVEPQLNAMALPRFDQALAEAQAADKALSEGKVLGALHGLPITVKEQFMLEGMDTTIGLTRFKGKPFSQDGPLIGQLRKEGAIVMGKSNIMQTLLGYESYNPVYGRTNHPLDQDRTPGGSSGGEAALLASMATPLGIGADLGGSIRMPSAFCGIHGFKSTARRFTIADTPGHVLFGPGQNVILPVTGPMARSVKDLEMILQLWSDGPFQLTADLQGPVSWQSSESVELKQLRIGYFLEDDLYPVSPAIKRSIQEAAQALESQGLEVKAFDFSDFQEGVSLFLKTGFLDGGRWFMDGLGKDEPIPALKGLIQGLKAPALMRKLLVNISKMQGQHSFAWTGSHLGEGNARVYFERVQEVWNYRNRFHKALDEAGIDILLCPVCATPAFRHDTSGDLTLAASYSMVFNTLGVPAGTLSVSRVKEEETEGRAASKDKIIDLGRRTDLGSAGLPVAIQVVGRHWHEAEVLKVMYALEDHFSQQTDYPAGSSL